LGPYNAVGSGLAAEFSGTADCLSISDRTLPRTLGFAENPSAIRMYLLRPVASVSGVAIGHKYAI
jgi:hypothetical protein